MQQQILDAVRRIPRGEVASYGEVAARAGLPRRARLVGRVLAALPSDSTVPWHRVVNAQRRISLPANSRAAREQQRRLRAEGLRVEGARVRREGGVDAGQLDRLLWGAAPAALSRGGAAKPARSRPRRRSAAAPR